MIKVTFLGTCSGTEPIAGRHHCSIVFEINGIYYWFDAGENCSHAAYTSGIDVQRIRAVFISHMHIDHVGGLANLIFTIRKVSVSRKIPHMNNNSYDVFVPDLEKFAAIRLIANAHRKGNGVDIVEHLVSDGVVFEDENIRVSALHNDHLREADTGDWHSYSYLIEAEGKRIVFSGDVHYPHELDPLLEGGCDLLIMETGHHKVADVCEFAKSRGAKKLVFNHHGREILRSVSDAEAVIKICGIDGMIANDGDDIEM